MGRLTRKLPLIITLAPGKCKVNRKFGVGDSKYVVSFYPRDAMLARVFAIATCLSVRPSVRLSHAGIVISRAKAGS